MRIPPWYLVVPLALSACGDLHIKSVHVSSVVPEVLQGEWLGTWTSTTDQGGGDMTLRVQEFGGEPVISILVANPCLVPAAYEVVMTGSMFELRTGGEVVLAATLEQNRTLVGSYGCATDGGTWQAVWHQALPAILDLSGTWEGAVAEAASQASPLVMSLHQSVRGGQLVLDGAMDLPGLLSATLPVLGSVRFREGTFEIILATPNGTEPSVQLGGLGDSTTRSIGEGVFAASPGPLLPFTQAGWGMHWVSP
jgi:hypothetical protein